MVQLDFMDDLAIVAATGVAAAMVVRLLRLPAVAGLLVAGAVAGPHGLGFVRDAQLIENLAEVGVIVLLFTIGLEFSLSKLRRIARLLAIGGALQVGLTVGLVTAVGSLFGLAPARGVFFGLVAALSSTAIVLRGLMERRELDAPHGRIIVGTLIFQDLAVVPMMLVLPVLAGSGGSQPLLEIGWALGKAAALVTVTVLVARFLLPPLFARVDQTRSREVFLLAVLVVCIGTAWLTAHVGLSLALGAFLAGIVLAESDFGHRALGDVIPLRDLFTSLFFMSLGMLFDSRVLVEHPVTVALLFAALFFVKGLVATLAVLPLRPPPRVAVLAGVGLAQFGEFGFVLAKEGQQLGLILPDESRLLLSAGILTMFVTPVAMRAAPTLAAGAARLQGLSRLLGVADASEIAPSRETTAGHVLIGGYGVAGQVLAKALRAGGVPYLVLELNAERVRASRALGEPVYYGDVSNEETLGHANATKARAIVLLINDPEAARRALRAARHFAPQVPVLMRAHYASDGEELRALGAADVVCEEIEAGVEMLARVLRRMGVPRNVLSERLRQARADTAPSARDTTIPRRKLRAVPELDSFKVESFLVREKAYCTGRSVADMRLRSETRALVVAIHRDGTTQEHPPSTEPLASGDVLFLMGSGEALSAAMLLLERGPRGSESLPA